ncbi:hypothetical protein H6F96_19585 [Microcoleus sp. FACHB-53]|nr:hypothetical protein [Microcoleus sp. FACHB-53]
MCSHYNIYTITQAIAPVKVVAFFSGGQMSLKNNERLIKALVPDAVGKDLARLREHLGVSTLSNVVAIAIRKLAIAEFQQNAATSSDYESKEVA